MSSSRLAAHVGRSVLRSEPCVFCQARQFTTAVRRLDGAPKSKLRVNAPRNSISKRDYATQILDVQRLRVDVDKRARLGFYTLNKKQDVLKIEAHTADAIITDFLAQRSNLDHGSNIRRLATSASI